MPFAVIVLALVAALPLQQAGLLAPTGTLRASFIENNPVQGRVDAKTGAITGPAADLVRELARRMGVKYEITPLPSAGAVLESVRSGKMDIGFLAFEAARAEQVDFSDPYSSSGSAYAVRANSALKSSADVDRPGVTIGAIAGQSPEVYVREHSKNARVESLSSVPPNAAIGKMLLDGKFDAFAANRTRMEEMVREVPGLRVLPDDFTATLQSIVVAKGKKQQLDAVNRFLAEVRASGFVKTSLAKADLAGVTVAAEPKR